MSGTYIKGFIDLFTPERFQKYVTPAFCDTRFIRCKYKHNADILGAPTLPFQEFWTLVRWVNHVAPVLREHAYCRAQITCQDRGPYIVHIIPPGSKGTRVGTPLYMYILVLYLMLWLCEVKLTRQWVDLSYGYLDWLGDRHSWKSWYL